MRPVNLVARIVEPVHMKPASRLCTGRGVIASVITACFLVVCAAGCKSPGAAFLVFLVISPLIWWGCWLILARLRKFWDDLVRGRTPQVKVGRAWEGSSSTRLQLCHAGNADIFADRGGIFLRRRRWFIASGTPPLEIPQGRWQEAAGAQLQQPQQLATWRDRSYWWYQDAFYWATAGAYTSEDVKALLFTRQRNHERELAHAHAVLAASTSPAADRPEPIPHDMPKAVSQDTILLVMPREEAPNAWPFLCPHCERTSNALICGQAHWSAPNGADAPPAEWTLLQHDPCRMPTAGPE